MIRRMIRQQIEGMRRHVVPVLIVLAATTVGQIATLMQQPLVGVQPDTHTYIDTARDLLGWAHIFVEPIRTPGYPGLLAVIFGLAGGIALEAVVFVQVGITVLTLVECYVLIYRLINRRWAACAIVALLGLNLYFLSWERVIYTELLSWWSLVTLFLCYERLVRRPDVVRSLLFGGVALLSIMIRPANLIVPALLLALLVVQLLRAGTLRPAWRQLALATVVVYGGVLGYMGVNRHYWHYFGVTDTTNINLFGKVEEYHLEYLPIDPQYAGIQADTQTFVSSRTDPYDVPDPFQFPGVAPSKKYWQSGYSPMGAYATAVIRRYPGIYLIDSLEDMVTTWQAPAELYAPYGTAPNGAYIPPPSSYNGSMPGITSYLVHYHGYVTTQYEPTWVNMLLLLSTFEQWSYYLLPVLLLCLLVWVWRRPKHIESFVMLAMLATVLVTIAGAAFESYSEFYRLRFPMDWAMIAAAGIVLFEVFSFLFKSGDQARRAARAPSGGVWRQGLIETIASDREVAEHGDEHGDEDGEQPDTLKLPAWHVTAPRTPQKPTSPQERSG